ncbi:LPXTG cell wall anchor domain-containing protein [Bacillus pretiosus]|uniref:LPXTG cell wall anchor domain-containing protein n=1 Tax=Bacillus TaxID=1386 RepID=UPI003D6528EB
MIKKCLFLMLFMFALIPIFSFHETVLADKMNSKAGITFSNSYIPKATTDSIIPDGSTLVVKVSDDRISNNLLPKTGRNSSSLIQCVGLGSMLVALGILVTLARNNNREDRNQKFLLNK